MKPRDIKENIRLCLIAYAFCEIAHLQREVTLKPDKTNFIRNSLKVPVKNLKKLKVKRDVIGKFINDNTQLPLKLQFIESFRKTESRMFWE